jgi:hypothetical protein
VSLVIKCPTNCEHDLPFAHTVITSNRFTRTQRVEYVTIICRDCEHWIARRGQCSCICHADTEAPDYEGQRVYAITS